MEGVRMSHSQSDCAISPAILPHLQTSSRPTTTSAMAGPVEDGRVLEVRTSRQLSTKSALFTSTIPDQYSKAELALLHSMFDQNREESIVHSSRRCTNRCSEQDGRNGLARIMHNQHRRSGGSQKVSPRFLAQLRRLLLLRRCSLRCGPGCGRRSPGQASKWRLVGEGGNL